MGWFVSLEARLLEFVDGLKCEGIKKGIEDDSWDLCLKMDGFTEMGKTEGIAGLRRLY